MPNIAVFLPGLMGSALRKRRPIRQDLWTQDAHRIYKTLVNDPDLLRYTGVPADDTEPLDYVASWFTRTDFYTKLVSFLQNHQDFGQQNALLLFSYDWRRSLDDILGDLRRTLHIRYGLKYDSDGRAQEEPGYKFCVIGHSMGGVLAFLAVCQEILHPNNVRTLVLMGAPLAGSPTAFRAFYDLSSLPLPFVSDIIGLWWGKNKSLARRKLQEVIQTFPSLYELMPPERETYLFDGYNGGFVNPFGQNVFDTAKVQQAKRLHSRLDDLLRRPLPLPIDRIHIIYGDNVDTDFSYVVTRIVKGGRPAYELNAVYQVPNGDGTVTIASALYRNELQGKAILYFFPERHSTMCESDRVLRVLQNLL